MAQWSGTTHRVDGETKRDGVEPKRTEPEEEDPNAQASRWMRAYLGGDASAFASLFDAMGPRIYRYALRLCRDATLAEDLVQTTFLNAHRARETFRPSDRVVPWLFTIAQNAFRDELRRRQRRASTPTPDGELPRGLEAPAPLGTPHLVGVVQRALEALTAEQREVVLLHKIEGLSMQEVADALGISSGAARVRAHRGYKAIAEYISEHGE